MTIKKFNISYDKFMGVISYLQNGTISKFSNSGVLLNFIKTGPSSKQFIYNLIEYNAIVDKTKVFQEYISYSNLDIGSINSIPIIGFKGDIEKLAIPNDEIVIFNCY